jgi:hypothetical protein
LTAKRESELGGVTGPVKMEAAALLVGSPFYVLVAVLLLDGAAQFVALAGFGLAAGAWVAWRTRRILRRAPALGRREAE